MRAGVARNPPASEGATSTSCAGGQTLKGVDVSHYDGTISWTKAKAAGISFAFAKATESDNYVDPTFATNWAGMKAAGVVRGAYHFFDPSVSATTQANYVLKTVGTLGANDLPIVLDFEQLSGVSESTAVAGAVTFLAAVTKATGKTAILYMSSEFLSGSYSALAPYTLWVANYGVSCPGMPSEWSTWSLLAKLRQRQRERHPGRRRPRYVQRLARRPHRVHGRIRWQRKQWKQQRREQQQREWQQRRRKQQREQWQRKQR